MFLWQVLQVSYCSVRSAWSLPYAYGVAAYRIPAGALVVTSPYVTHRLPQYWEEPEAFQPERFLPQAAARRHRFAFYPFGGGPRLCIGNGFAMLEARLVLATVAQRWAAAHRRGAARILMMGAHLLRAGVSRHIIDLLERGALSVIAMNGAGLIHDYELARIGATTESVARYIREGQFGLWQETGELNGWIRDAAAAGEGLGEHAGRRIHESDFPFRDWSVLAAAWRCGVPVTVHAGIGFDILHEHPDCDGGALGETSYRDFLIFARVVEGLEGGVLLSFGSAIMAPQVFEKSISCVNNLRLQAGRKIVRNHTIYVVDIQDGGNWDWSKGEPPKDNPAYYLRFCKSFARMGGKMIYAQCNNVAFLHHLLRELSRR